MVGTESKDQQRIFCILRLPLHLLGCARLRGAHYSRRGGLWRSRVLSGKANVPLRNLQLKEIKQEDKSEVHIIAVDTTDKLAGRIVGRCRQRLYCQGNLETLGGGLKIQSISKSKLKNQQDSQKTKPEPTPTRLPETSWLGTPEKKIKLQNPSFKLLRNGQAFDKRFLICLMEQLGKYF
ncbi:hypothetical protein AMECASPLE_018663 [Ameca splendens]|uniref:Uncharacterized protein n=1 Tax=Ameca splendens TaxID=208324 RepID=A0ABV0ZCB8_9TELE